MSDDEVLLINPFKKDILNSLDIKKRKRDYYIDLKENGWNIIEKDIIRDVNLLLKDSYENFIKHK